MNDLTSTPIRRPLSILTLITLLAVQPLLCQISIPNLAGQWALLRNRQQIAAGHYLELIIDVPYSNRSKSIFGNVTASGGSGNDIRIFVLNERQRLGWRPGSPAIEATYDSGKRHLINLRVPITQ